MMFTNTARVIALSSLLVIPGLAVAASTDAEAAYHRKSYEKAMADLKAATDEIHRFYALGPAAKQSLGQGQDADAKAFAEELERLTPEHEGDWNYGNAVQDSNVVLGVLALKAGDAEAAKTRLIAAGHSPGSPQMDSFGPNMTLAQALIATGEKTTVIEYFGLCKKFWKMQDGKLDEWKKDVEEGRPPDFGANLDY